jgi:hypothetical protein
LRSTVETNSLRSTVLPYSSNCSSLPIIKPRFRIRLFMRNSTISHTPRLHESMDCKPMLSSVIALGSYNRHWLSKILNNEIIFTFMIHGYNTIKILNYCNFCLINETKLQYIEINK